MRLITKKSECKKNIGNDVMTPVQSICETAQSKSDIRYCIIVKPHHSSLAGYEQKIFNGMYVVNSFSEN